MLALALEILGHAARVAHDGPSGLATVLSSAPHLVVIDLVLPSTNGWSVARAIRSLPLALQPRLVAITGCRSDEARARSFAAGFDEHFTKPLAASDLSRIAHGAN